MGEKRTVTLKDLAEATGLTVASVSYALRGASKIPPETVARVKKAAERLGYRPNPRVAELMAMIRRGGPVEAGERLALVWVEGDRAEARGNAFLRTIKAGAAARATERGYRLEEFWLGEVEGKPARLAAILRARGIGGVVFGPLVAREAVEIAWPWDDFAMAVVGMARWPVALSRAAHFHYEAMVEAVRRSQEAGARRPAAIIDHDVNERAKRAWEGAWLAHAGPGANERLWVRKPGERKTPRAWLRRVKPDALVLDGGGALERVRAAGWGGGAERTTLLSWRSGCEAAGLDQRYDLIAGHAVDLVVAQLLRGERGVPVPPRTLLFPGQWREK